MLPLWIHLKISYNKFTILLSEITIWDNQALASDKTHIQLLQIKSNNSTINSTLVKTSQFQAPVILMLLNSMNQLINISEKQDHQQRVKYQIKNSHTLHHLLCSKETTKFPILVLAQSLLLQVGMIQISLLCTTSPKSLGNIELINIQEPILTQLICNTIHSIMLQVHIQILSYTSHSIYHILIPV